MRDMLCDDEVEVGNAMMKYRCLRQWIEKSGWNERVRAKRAH